MPCRNFRRNFSAFCVFKLRQRQLQVRKPARYQEFDKFAALNIIAQFKYRIIPLPLDNRTGKQPFAERSRIFVILADIGNLAVMKTEAVAAILQSHKLRHILFARPPVRIRIIVVNCLPIGTSHHAGIIFGFVAPFHFQRVHPDSKQIIQSRHQAHILRIQQIAAMFVLHHFIILAGTKILLQKIFKIVFVLVVDDQLAHRPVFHTDMQFVMPAATMRAFSFVCTPVCHKVGNQAPPRIRHTHCPVHKTFQFNIRTLPADFRHFLKRNLAPQNAEFRPHRLPEPDRLRRTDIRLRGNETVQLRRIFLKIVKHARVRHQYAVRFQAFQRIHKLRQLLCFFIMNI